MIYLQIALVLLMSVNLAVTSWLLLVMVDMLKKLSSLLMKVAAAMNSGPSINDLKFD